MNQSVSTLRKLLVFACMLGLLMPSVGGASNIFVKIKGSTQGNFKSNPKTGIPVLGYQHQIESPKDMASGRAKGSRQHGAITIVKEWDASSPQLFQALVTNEQLKEVTFEFKKTDSSGQQVVYYKIKLTNASVSKIEYRSGTENDATVSASTKSTSAKSAAANATGELEYVSYTYQKIDVESVEGSTAASDDSRAR
ncbi:MAG: type VI secretion system tube protein Hcp [Deltaproteobacteria bacterium]|nr:type VI secretion system tube protein Hcp [Deltaproteobacteria bacterium]